MKSLNYVLWNDNQNDSNEEDPNNGTKAMTIACIMMCCINTCDSCGIPCGTHPTCN